MTPRERAQVATAIPIPPWTIRGGGQKLSTYIHVSGHLQAQATNEEMEQLASRALENHCAGICVASSHIPLVARTLKKSAVKPIVVIGFPFGTMLAEAKAHEAVLSVRAGAQGVEMMMNLGLLREGMLTDVMEDIRHVVQSVPEHPVAVVIEMGSIPSRKKIEQACRTVLEAGAACAATGSGFQGRDILVEDVRLLREIVGPGILIKAMGAIKKPGLAWELVKAGANLIGTASFIPLVRGDHGPEAIYHGH